MKHTAVSIVSITTSWKNLFAFLRIHVKELVDVKIKGYSKSCDTMHWMIWKASLLDTLNKVAHYT